MLTILFATGNRHKVREVRRLLRACKEPLQIRLLTLDLFPQLPSVREDGATFQANAIKKAVAASRRTILPVLSEDSGLEVRALKGRPGVRSARFASSGRGRNSRRRQDQANNNKLFRLLEEVPPSRRQARYVCVMALALGGRLIRTFGGSCSGSIAVKPAGRTGFGYDPAFIPRGHAKTFAQLGGSIKDVQSHRMQAVKRLTKWLR